MTRSRVSEGGFLGMANGSEVLLVYVNMYAFRDERVLLKRGNNISTSFRQVNIAYSDERFGYISRE